MKIIQSYWTKPNLKKANLHISDRNNGGWLDKRYNYFSWALSCLTLRELYKEVELYTDEQGAELLINKFITSELQNISGLTIIGPRDSAKRSGIVSFYIANKDHHQIALMLDETSKIMVRSGQHCVHSWFNARNINGSVRASFYFYNTIEEAETFITEFKKVISIF